ncbi:hypothetical protein [Nitrosomonas communis]|uniref:Uncharacterized protein n=1 Tax=Nitrosomonas communis TaxID=44574 RepID=A0A1I4LU44_9PROT|nr:hypothetical protein [Nitrosomonas communis]SFL94459.1 hypothetical protein SAMN05421863_100794 [Nitrosomonas communis]
MGGPSSVERSKKLGDGWTTLEWSALSGFCITMHTDNIRLRKRWSGIPYGETSGNHLCLSWLQTLPYGDIQAKGNRPGIVVSYTYSP